MVWYYAQENQQKGPVSESEFEELIGSGIITPRTLVWKEGMKDWTPLEGVRSPQGSALQPGEVGSVPGLPPIPPDPTAGGVAPPATGGVQCARCHRVVAPGFSGTVAGMSICHDCRPELLRSLAGLAVPEAGANPQVQFGGVTRRCVARFIDNLGLTLVESILLTAFTDVHSLMQELLSAVDNGDQATIEASLNQLKAATLPYDLAMVGVGVVYFTLFTGWSGATPGKKLMNLKVVDEDLNPVDYNRAFLRAVIPGMMMAILILGAGMGGFIISWLFLFGYGMAISDSQKRTLFDRICRTRVVRDGSTGNGSGLK